MHVSNPLHVGVAAASGSKLQPGRLREYTLPRYDSQPASVYNSDMPVVADWNETEKLAVAELVCYVSDYERAVAFYTETLGFKLVWKGEGFCGLDIAGQFSVSLVDAVHAPGWQPGQPLPEPQLSMQSADLPATISRIRSLGYNTVDTEQDAASAQTTAIAMPGGRSIFVFAAGADSPAPKPSAAESAYPFVEALYFVDDLDGSEKFFADCFGLLPFIHHGDVYSGLASGGVQADGYAVGLMHWPQWWETPAAGEPPAPPRLALECTDLAAVHARLDAVGAAPSEIKREADGLAWFHVSDPDGHVLTYWQFSQGD